MNGWIGVDLDGTLAFYDHWRGAGHIGEPIPAMVQRVKQWLAEGKTVKIFTARVWAPTFNPSSPDDEQAEQVRRIQEALTARSAIEAWCEKHIGQVLEVTNVKDYGMLTLYDDRAVQVIANTGQPVT